MTDLLSPEDIAGMKKRVEARSNWRVEQHRLTPADDGCLGTRSWSEVVGYPETTVQNQIAHCADDEDAQLILAIPRLLSSYEYLSSELEKAREALTCPDQFRGAALLAYNVLGQWEQIAAFANIQGWPDFRDRLRIEMARGMLKDYLPPELPEARAALQQGT